MFYNDNPERKIMLYFEASQALALRDLYYWGEYIP